MSTPHPSLQLPKVLGAVTLSRKGQEERSSKRQSAAKRAQVQEDEGAGADADEEEGIEIRFLVRDAGFLREGGPVLGLGLTRLEAFNIVQLSRWDEGKEAVEDWCGSFPPAPFTSGGSKTSCIWTRRRSTRRLSLCRPHWRRPARTTARLWRRLKPSRSVGPDANGTLLKPFQFSQTDLLRDLTSHVQLHRTRLSKDLDVLAAVDVSCSLAEAATKHVGW